MNGDEIVVRRIVSEINAELSNIMRLRDEYDEFINKYKMIDKYLLRVKASYLADFYMGIERVFKIIAEEIDGGIPQGDELHKEIRDSAQFLLDSLSICLSFSQDARGLFHGCYQNGYRC